MVLNLRNVSEIVEGKDFIYFKTSYGWSDKFQKGHKSSYKKSPEAGSVNMGEMQDLTFVLYGITADCNREIYTTYMTEEYFINI